MNEKELELCERTLKVVRDLLTLIEMQQVEIDSIKKALIRIEPKTK